MKKFTLLKAMLIGLVLLICFEGQTYAQVEIPKDDWTAYAYRYRDWGMPEWAIDNDRSDESFFGMGGSAEEGRWFMVDLGESYDVVKVKLEYLRPGDNFIKGFDVYVTDFEYPVEAASAPGSEEGVVGDLFPKDENNITATVEFPLAEKIHEVEFEVTKGRYVWIVSNGPTAEWWELHEFSVFMEESDEPVDELEIAKDEWFAYAYRYRDWGLPEWAIDNDRTDASIFGMGGSASEGRWFMVDMGESYLVGSVLLEYLRTGDNFIKGFDVYVTDFEYPVAAATAPGSEEEVVGELFPKDEANITATVEFPLAEKVQEVVFDTPAQGRYIWIVSNGPTAEWWELHEFSAFRPDGTSVRESQSSLFAIYPNPTQSNGAVNVNVISANARQMVVADITGRVVFKTDNLIQGVNTFHLDLNTGIYLITVDGQETKKLMVR